ncbi:reverse transcriptase domain-containing protein [Sandaracinus amylolyticus]|uniref:reverse transcriptase domain-containing protein n=1 Tax=Sandaracinus amylolyticus TaxID=927083 RepID=UPI001F0A6D00|nr:reverse transcriptase domain-containing protein [Sandaracinus amylolyticus]
MPCSYGFRPGRSAHHALRELNRILWTGEAAWVLEADIESFFDSIDREMLKEMLRRRILSSIHEIPIARVLPGAFGLWTRRIGW